MEIIFLRVGWMDYYQGLGGGDTITGGGSYVAQYGFGHEIFNFRPWNGQMFGYVQPPGAAHNAESNRTIDIGRLGASKSAASVSNVLAVWVATRPGGGIAIVGWYKNATVFREWQKPPPQSQRHHNDREFGFFVTAAVADARLLPKDERVMLVPKGKNGMGQSNIWYAAQGAVHTSFRQSVETLVTSGKPPQAPVADGPAHQADPYLRQQVERAAVTATIKYYNQLGYTVGSVEKDNKGWDLEAIHPALNGCLKLEVKGLAGEGTCVELTPNEFEQMKKHRDDYRLCVVTSALQTPHLAVFAYSHDSANWQDLAMRVLQIAPFVGARCTTLSKVI